MSATKEKRVKVGEERDRVDRFIRETQDLILEAKKLLGPSDKMGEGSE